MPLFEPEEQEPKRENPMLRAFGAHKDIEKTCKDCTFLKKKDYAKVYYKCEYRGDTGGPATDHRKHWRACTLFEDKKEDL